MQSLTPRVRKNQRGAVSLFVVVFATLLITVLTVGFVRIMLTDQQQAMSNDLSQSAYDSALAGVEDAKRALLACADGSDTACAAIEAGECTTLLDAGVVAFSGQDASSTEVLIQSTIGDGSQNLNQAYTCVIVEPNTKDVLQPLGVNESIMVPLRGVGPFADVQVSWTTSTDTAGDPTYYNNSVTLPSADSGEWAPSTPSLLRAQLVQFADDGFTLDDFNVTDSGSNANTLFLYPTAGMATSPVSEFSFVSDVRQVAGQNEPKSVSCVPSYVTRDYACSAILSLPTPVGGDASGADRQAYLRLNALYNATNVKLELLNGSTKVLFDNVQPEVDSTGRANDLFRRVQARVRLDSNFAYPESAVDVSGNLCKNFLVTNTPTDYENSCTP